MNIAVQRIIHILEKKRLLAERNMYIDVTTVEKNGQY